MSTSIIGGLIHSGWPNKNIRVSDPVEAQRHELENKFGVQCFSENPDCAEPADVVVLGVKPQILEAAVNSISHAIKLSEPLVISIAAGIPSDSIVRWIGRDLPVVRVMPNTPALVNRGVSGMYATPQVDQAQKGLAEQLLRAVGEVVWVENEELIDTVTGVSGSGPAYYFKVMELMIAEGIENGLSPSAARTLVVETARGAAKLIQKSPLDPSELRRQVTSPGGTTEAGITYMEQSGIDDTIRGGVKAAIKRSIQLSKQFGGN